MIAIARKGLHIAGIDRAVLYGLTGRAWNLLSGPVTVLLIAARFSPELQGYYYTFNSLLGLQVFVELGLTTVVMQFASHEWSRLALNPTTGLIEGPADALSRLVAVGRLASAWFGVAAAIAMGGLSIGGYAFFSLSPSHGIAWSAPWLTLCVLSAANLFLLPVFSILEGCNQVSSVYGYRSVQMIVSNIVTWTVMYLGGGLWAAVAAQGTNLAAALVFLGTRYRFFFQPFFSRPLGHAVSWRRDMLPMQWRLAVSYLASYFTFSIFTPLMFHYQGPVIAGQMGLTLTVALMVASVAGLWSATKAPRFGVLIARRAYAELDDLFSRLIVQAETVLAAGGIGLGLVIYALNAAGLKLASRFLSPDTAALLIAGMVAANVCGPMSVYLRAHKREPYVVLSVSVGLLTGVSTWIMAMYAGPRGVAAAYLAVSALVALPAGLLIFARCRSAWHADGVLVSAT